MAATLIPWRGGCRHRQAALAWVTSRHTDVTIGTAPDGPWCKATAVQDAIEHSTADLLVISDGDVWCDGLPQAVEAVEQGAAWAVPHYRVHRLTEQATADVLGGDEPDLDATEEHPYIGHPGGGVVVLHRDTYQQVPLDPRFQGWGQEDDSWGLALRMMLGRPWRGEAPLVHLWHPPQERRDRRIGNEANRELWRRYRNTRTRPLMEALLAEARCSKTSASTTAR